MNHELNLVALAKKGIISSQKTAEIGTETGVLDITL
jgi:hypothetical protein